MSRRDTIIVAILVNAGLLIVLFATALKSNITPPEKAVVSTVNAPSSVVADVPLPAETSLAIAPLVPVEPPLAAPPPLNFAEDLKAFAMSPPPLPSFVETLPPVHGEEKWIEFKVKKGDVLEKIARHHQTTVAEIMKANHLQTTNLRIGQVLKIPVSSAQRSLAPLAASVPIAPTQGEGAENYYIVKKGDNPWTIAVKNHMKVEDLLKLNHLSQDQARHLKPGDKLRIR